MLPGFGQENEMEMPARLLLPCIREIMKDWIEYSGEGRPRRGT